MRQSVKVDFDLSQLGSSELRECQLVINQAAHSCGRSGLK
jgi:hypothetical protein